MVRTYKLNITTKDLEPLLPTTTPSPPSSPPPPSSPLGQQQVTDRSKDQQQTLKRTCGGGLPHIGLFLAVISSFFYSFSSLLIKMLTDVTFLELCVARHGILSVLSLLLLVHHGDLPFPKGYRLPLVLMGVMVTFALLLQSYSFKHVPLADATVIVFSTPVFGVILASIFLGEMCSFFHFIMILITMTGIVFIARPQFIFKSQFHHYTAQSWWGIWAAFISTLFAAVILVMIRKVKDLHYTAVMFSSTVTALIITCSFALYEGQLCTPQNPKDRIILLAFGASAFISMLCNTKALQKEEVGLVSITRTTAVVFSFIWQTVFFQEYPDLLTLVGSLLVMSCVILIGLYKWVTSLPPTSSTRQALACLISQTKQDHPRPAGGLCRMRNQVE
ncbi:hypothetical protein Pmani_039287 [Petrolisthes manimaculis]|uniref:EamA domain-containing protein n=1 Tax=Petrolisthes manimaculis TaxID=1843537 RepID=A0AAE1TLH6_9EUCA|nr:hypothetical protein Pmani_039287 [Petrolisthes manimaculis]